MSGPFHIESVHVFIATEPDGTEGVPAIFLDGMWMPLIAADERRLASLLPVAQDMADIRGISIRLVRFSTKEEVARIVPRPIELRSSHQDQPSEKKEPS